MIGFGIYSLVTGNTLSIARGELITNRESDFAGFWLMTLFVFYFGATLIKVALSDEIKRPLQSNNFKKHEDFLKYKRLERSIRNNAMAWAVVGFLSSFLVAYGSLIPLNIDGDSCIKCQTNGDWWALLFFGSMILLPVFFFHLSIKFKTNSLIKTGKISKYQLKRMQLFKGNYKL